MAVNERIYVATPIQEAGNRVIASPFQFGVTGEDNLRVSVANSLTGVVVAIHGRFITPDGKIESFGHTFTPTADRMMTSRNYPLGVGYILNLVAFASNGSPKLGQTFVRIDVIRGFSAATIVLGTMLQGYVTSKQALAWPGSPIIGSTDVEPPPRTLAGTQPAAGAEVAETVPAGARWLLVYFQARLDTDASVTTRNPRLAFNVGFPALIHLPCSGNAGPSEQKYFGWVDGGALDTDHSPNVSTGPLPAKAVLTAGQVIATNTNNLVPGDQWRFVSYSVQEWLEVD